MKRILDLGCGKGITCNYLSKKNKDASIYGIDISNENIKICNENKISDNQIFKVSSGEKIPFKDNYFDEVHCYEVLEHVNDLNKTLSEIKRVLKRGGEFFLSVPLEESEKILQKYNKNYMKQIGHKRMFSRNKIILILNKNGFEIIKYDRLNSMNHLFWKYLFKKKIKILDQNGKTESNPPIWLRSINVFFYRSSYHFYLGEKKPLKKFVHLICIFGSPFGKILDFLLLNKQQKIICRLK